MAAAPEVTAQVVASVAEFSIGDGRSIEDLCATIAKSFHVRKHEVALLNLDRRMLHFLAPAELKSAGAIPLSSSAVAARTAHTKRSELFNNFVVVQHSSIFETIKLGTRDSNSDPLTIQKMMSVPVLGQNGIVLGVLQVSKKGYDLRSAGPDFTPSDLSKLTDTATVVGRLLPHLIEAETKIQ
jgi:hypothetical protein